jgi:hypothetical protein
VIYDSLCANKPSSLLYYELREVPEWVRRTVDSTLIAELDKYPQQFLNRYAPKKFYFHKVEYDGNINSGLYLKKNNEIILNMSRTNLPWLGGVIHHEMMHCFMLHPKIDSIKVKELRRAVWMISFKEFYFSSETYRTNYEQGFVSSYAWTNIDEDIAELWSVGMTRSSHLGYDVVMRYIRDHPKSKLRKKQQLIIAYVTSLFE